MAEKNLYKLIALGVAIFAYLFLIFAIVTYIKKENKLKKDYGFNVEEAIVVNIDSLIKDKPKPIEKLKPEPVAKPVIKPAPIVLPPDPEPKPKPIIKKPDPIILPPDPEPVPEPKKPEPIVLPPDPEPEPEPKKPEPIVLPPDPEPEAKKEEAKKEQESRDRETRSAKDLFSTLRVDDYKKEMAEKRKQEKARASRLKKQKAKKAKKAAKKRKAKLAKEKKRRQAEARAAQELIEQMQISTPSNNKKSGEKHEFWSFVSSKIMSKWQRTVSTQDGLSATVTIRIDSQGRLTYSDLKSSYNSLFDTKLKVFLDNLEYERFPSYKDGPFIEAEFEFTDKEKGL
jgi:hypothetical protein